MLQHMQPYTDETKKCYHIPTDSSYTSTLSTKHASITPPHFKLNFGTTLLGGNTACSTMAGAWQPHNLPMPQHTSLPGAQKGALAGGRYRSTPTLYFTTNLTC